MSDPAENIVGLSDSSLLCREVTSSARMRLTEVGWLPSLVITRNTGRIPDCE